MKLLVNHLNYAYDSKKEVLFDISFDVAKGEVLSVIGPNGSGKTTLFKCVLGFLHPQGGEVLLENHPIEKMSAKERAAKMAYIPQLSFISSDVTVAEYVLMGTARFLSPVSLPTKAQEDKAKEALELVGMDSLSDRKMSKISGGECQLVMIARALAQQADVLIMDEPTSALDYGNQIRVMNVIQTLAKKGYTILISMHNPKAARKYSSKTLAIMDHKVKAFGPSEEVITEDFINELYSIEVG